jgi:hypothetical protein
LLVSNPKKFEKFSLKKSNWQLKTQKSNGFAWDLMIFAGKLQNLMISSDKKLWSMFTNTKLKEITKIYKKFPKN